METVSSARLTNSVAPGKNHYVVLDGLRGVASLMVLAFHSLEPFSHGAYDDRWGRMTQWGFYKRRLIRLQPMVIMGSLIGGALFYLQKGSAFPLIATTPIWKMLLVMLLGCTLLPLPVSMDIRGWQEMLWNASSVEVKAPPSSIETHKFIANGFRVRLSRAE